MAFAISLGLFAGSLTAIVLMLARKRPALKNLSLKEEVQRTVEDSGLVAGGPFSLFKEHIGASRFWHSGVMVAMEKTLRRFRLGFLKAERRIGAWIESLHRELPLHSGGHIGRQATHCQPLWCEAQDFIYASETGAVKEGIVTVQGCARDSGYGLWGVDCRVLNSCFLFLVPCFRLQHDLSFVVIARFTVGHLAPN